MNKKGVKYVNDKPIKTSGEMVGPVLLAAKEIPSLNGLIIIQNEVFQQLLQLLEELLSSRPTSDPEPMEELLTSKEVCRLLKISPRTLQNYRDKGKLPFTKVGKKNIYYDRSSILNMIKANAGRL